MSKIYFGLFLVALFAHEGKAQTQNVLDGKVVDKSNSPLAGVMIDFNAVTISSDAEGKFLLTYPDTLKNRTIRFSMFGYKTKTMQLNKGQENIRVILFDSLYNLQGAIVTTPKYGRFSDYSAQNIKMSMFDIVTNPSAMADILGNMRVLPGVQTNDNDGRLIVQGGSPEESQVYINDLIVANPYTLASRNTGVRSRFTPDLFEGIVLQSGGFNAEFGQATSGIINLNTKEKEGMEAKTDLAFSSVYAGVTHIAKESSYAYRASIDYSNLAPYYSIISDGYDWNRPYQNLRGDFFLTKEFSAKTKMTTQLNFSVSDGNYSYFNVDSVKFDSDIKEKYLYAQINMYHAFNSKWTLSAASNLIADAFTMSDVSVKNDKVSDLSIWNHSKITLQYASNKITNRAGIEYIYNPYKQTYTLDEDFKLEVKNNLLSIYNDVKLYLTNNLTANAGLRGEYSPYLNRFNFAPRVYVGYRLNRENILSVSLGEYFQLPSMSYLKYSDAIDYISVTKGTASYGYVYKSSKFQLDAYYKKYHNLVTHSGDASYTSDFRNEGKGYGWGVDVFWKSNFRQLEYWLSYSYNNTKKQDAYFQQEIAPSYVSPHSFNMTLKYWISPLKTLAGISYNIAAGTPYYGNSSPYSELGKTPFHNRLDMSLSYIPKQWIVIHFGCQNILAYRNIYGYEYSKINPAKRQEISSPTERFLFLGLFITFSNNKKLNQLKSIQ